MIYQVAEKFKSDRAFFFYRGRVALYALLKAMGVGPGDEVLLQAFTCLAVPNPVVSIGATPVYVDISPTSLNIDPARVEEKITDKTKAIIVQHTFGVPADMDVLQALAQKHNLYLIEDCCHALGSRYNGQEVGTFGDAAFYSFEWGKPIIVGVGGGAIVNNAELAERMRRNYSDFVAPPFKEFSVISAEYFAHRYVLTPSLFWTIRDAYQFLSRRGLIVGSFRGEELKGQISPDYRKRMFEGFKRRLFRRLREIEGDIAHRRRIASYYAQILNDLGYEPVRLDERYDAVYLRYPLVLDQKERVLEAARKHRVELSGMFISPIHPLRPEEWMLMGYQRGTCPVAENASQSVVSLPTHSKIGEKDVSKTRSWLAHLVSEGALRSSAQLSHSV